MKKFLSITMCVMLAFATVFCLTACEKEDITPVYIRITDITGERKYIYSGYNLTLPYTGEEYVLEAEVVTIKGKVVTDGEPTVKSMTRPYGAVTPLKEKGFYQVRITYNSDYETHIFPKYSSAYFLINVDIR